VEGEKTGVFSQGEQRSVEGGEAPSKKGQGFLVLRSSKSAGGDPPRLHQPFGLE